MADSREVQESQYRIQPVSTHSSTTDYDNSANSSPDIAAQTLQTCKVLACKEYSCDTPVPSSSMPPPRSGDAILKYPPRMLS